MRLRFTIKFIVWVEQILCLGFLQTAHRIDEKCGEEKKKSVFHLNTIHLYWLHALKFCATHIYGFGPFANKHTYSQFAFGAIEFFVILKVIVM